MRTSLVNAFYNVAVSLAAPFGALWLAVRPRHRALLRRFRPLAESLSGRPLWLQACSVGEVNAIKPVLQAIRARWPDIPLLLTTSTVSGYRFAETSGLDATLAYFPFDHPWIVRGFLDRARPRALVLMETELWPNVIQATRGRGIPVMLLNARLSDTHYPRYRRVRRLLQPTFAALSAVAAQNEEYVGRFHELGVPPAALRVTGNIKIDGVRVDGAEQLRRQVCDENRIPPDARVLLFGSTRPGDEALAAECWRLLRVQFADLHLVVAPRHRDRLGEALALFDDAVILRSEIRDGRVRTTERVLFVDTLGELVTFYAAATVAVIGGSFYPGVDGHNPLESAALGVATVFGPYMRNFIDPARILLEAGGAVQVQKANELCETLRALLDDPERRGRIGSRGREAILAGRGAIDRSLDLLEGLLAPAPSHD